MVHRCRKLCEGGGAASMRARTFSAPPPVNPSSDELYRLDMQKRAGTMNWLYFKSEILAKVSI